MAPAFYAFSQCFHTVDLTLCIVSFKPFICSHEKFPSALSHEESESTNMRGESKNLFFSRNMQHNSTAKEELINCFFSMLLLTDTVQIKVTLLASQPSL